MPDRSERSKVTKFRRKSKGKAERVFVREKSGKHKCAICKRVMHGTPHGVVASKVRKLSRTERRPTGPLAGVLCGKCRALVVSEAAMVRAGLKEKSDVEIRLQRFVESVKVE